MNKLVGQENQELHFSQGRLEAEVLNMSESQSDLI